MYIRPILLYAYPAVCNMSMYLKEKLIRVERRVLRIIGHQDYAKVTLFSVGDRICDTLFKKVVDEPLHPLRTFFNKKTISLRSNCVLRRPKTRTKRFLNSVRYCP